MRLVHLLARRLEGEDHTKDIDFTVACVEIRWQVGYSDTLCMAKRTPWQAPVDTMEGVVVHTL